MLLLTSIILAEPLLQDRLITRISCTTSQGIADSCVLRQNHPVKFLQHAVQVSRQVIAGVPDVAGVQTNPDLFAQFHLIQNGFQYWFSQDELSELEQNNEEFRAVIPEEEQLMASHEPCTEDDTDAVFMLNTEILKNLLRLSGLRTLSEQKLGRVLKARKFIRIKRQGRYGYLIKAKTQEIPTT